MIKMRQALLTRLEWQLRELSQHVLSIQEQLATLEKNLDTITLNMSASFIERASIVPEHEVSRAYFVANQQQKHHALHTEKTQLLAQKMLLTAQKTQRNTQLKMLEKHQARLLKNKQQHIILTQQNNIDEWIIQRRNDA